MGIFLIAPGGIPNVNAINETIKYARLHADCACTLNRKVLIVFLE